MTRSHDATSSSRVPASSRLAAAARSAVEPLRPGDAQRTRRPASIRRAPTAAPISPGWSKPIAGSIPRTVLIMASSSSRLRGDD